MKKNNLLILLIIILCTIGIITNIFLVFNNIFIKEFKIKTEQIVITEKKYSIKIDRIKSNDWNLNKKIDIINNSIKDTFLKLKLNSSAA